MSKRSPNALISTSERPTKRRVFGRLFPASVRELARGVIPLMVAFSLLNASNYIFHVAVSRLLGPREYGGLAAVLAVVIVISVPLSVAQTVVAKRTAILRTEGRDDEIDVLGAGTAKAFGKLGITGLIFLLVASPILSGFLHISVGSAALLGPYWLFSVILCVPLGVLQGRLRFTAFALVAVIGVAFRLGSGIGLVWAGFGVTGAILGTVLAQATSLAVAFSLIGLGKGWWSASRPTLEILRGDFRLALLTLGAFWLLAEVDVVLARRYLDPAAAGYYASAGLLARGLLFLPGAISIVALPRFAEARDGEEARRRLLLALGAVVGLVALAYAMLLLLRDPVVRLAFGARFEPAANLIPLLGAAMGVLAVVHLLVFFHIAEGTRAYRVTLTGLAAEVVLIFLFHGDPHQLGLIVLGTGVAMALVSYHAAVAACRWRTPAAKATAAADVAALNGQPSVNLSVVLPCHNAGRGLRGVLGMLRAELEELDSWEIIVVSDGSTDETVNIAEEFVSENIRVVHDPVRVGKGYALRIGLGQARGQFVAFMDADGDIDPRAIRPALSLMQLYNPDVVLGSKRHPLSQVSYPALRRVMSWTYHKLCRLLFRVNVRDTQTGFKLIRRDVLARVLPRMLEKRYAFDLEFLVVARNLGSSRVFEAPVRISYKFESQVNVRTAFRILLDTAAIFYRRYILDSYRPWAQERVPHTRPMLKSDVAVNSFSPESALSLDEDGSGPRPDGPTEFRPVDGTAAN